MSFFDLFSPEQAQAHHLRQIANSQRNLAGEAYNQRFHEQRMQRLQMRGVKSAEKRIHELEADLDQAGLMIEGLLQLLEEKQLISREELLQRATAVDAADGVIDGRISAQKFQDHPIIPKRNWNDAIEPPHV